MAVKFLKDENGKLYKDTATGKLVTVDTTLPELANPATAEDIASGKEAYGADGVVITGTAESVQNKLPLVVGYQDASNPYDITATDLEGVTEIKHRTFYGATGLRSIELPTTCTSIETYAFYGCTILTSVYMPNVTGIGQYAFIDCTALTSLTIPSTCTTIGTYALQCGSATNLCTFTFEGTTPPTITYNTFNASYINKIIVPIGCGETYKTATNWTTFADYIEEATE